jgi:hypothetical protein
MTRPNGVPFDPACAPSSRAPVPCRCRAAGTLRPPVPDGHERRLALRGWWSWSATSQRARVRGAIGRMRYPPLDRCDGFGRRAAIRIRSLYAGRGGRARSKDRATLRRSTESPDGRIVRTEVSCPRRMMMILQLRTVRPAQLARRRVTPSDRHAASAIAMIGAVTASSCQVSPRSELRSSRPSAMPQTSSPARAASTYGIDSPGTGSSRQESPTQR